MLKSTDIALRYAPALQIKRVGAAGVFEGYASLFGEIDQAREMVMPGAFAEGLAQLRQQGVSVKLLWQHDTFTPIGSWNEVAEDDVGLRVAGRFNLDTDAGRNAYAHVRDGDIDGLSIGYSIPDDGIEVDPQARVKRLKRIFLKEVSVVTFPMLLSARVDAVKTLGSMADLERGLRGEIRLSLPRGAAAKMAPAAWSALIGDSAPALNLQPLADRADRAIAELKNLKGLFR
jgi:uncharacterized protein